ncbi:SPOSA6832_03452, partial [Sporobolomyces salmonicolor]
MDPRPDYILVFSLSDQYSPVRPYGDKSESKLKQQRADQLQDEYAKLVACLRGCDFDVTGRSGAEGTETVLLFVKASEKRVREEVTRERMSDWLHGVASTRPSPREPKDFTSQPIEEVERLRVVYSILTVCFSPRPSYYDALNSPTALQSPREGGSSSIRSSASTGPTCGLPIASQLPPSPATKAEFPHLLSIFPPHNPIYNALWQKRWMSLPSTSAAAGASLNPLDKLTIPQSELDDLKAHLGEKVALYFAFLSYYFRSLVFPSVVGLLFWALGLPFHPIAGVGFVGYGILFVESWRLKERALAVHWGTYKLERTELQRPGFRGDGKEVDPVTGVTIEAWPFRKTLLRGLASLPAYAAFVAFLGALVSGIYVVETLLGEIYDGPGKRFLTLIPTVLFVTIVPQVTSLWQLTAAKLTSFENHPRHTEHEASLTIKIFALNFVSAYGNLLLTSFVYIPFGAFLIPHILSLLPSRHAAALCSASSAIRAGSFSINPIKLKTQYVAYSLTNQVSGAFLEVGLPYLKARFGPQVAAKLHPHSPEAEKHAAGSDHEDEKQFLERVRKEQMLPAPAIGGEFAEMATQFGYLCLFAVVWPIAPVWSLVNNFVSWLVLLCRCRASAGRPARFFPSKLADCRSLIARSLRSARMRSSSRRRLAAPFPLAFPRLGPGSMCSFVPLDSVFLSSALSRFPRQGFITYLGTLTTSALIYLYQPRLTYPSPTANYLSNLTSSNVTLPANGTVRFFSTRLAAAQSASLPPSSDAPPLLGALPPSPASATSLESIQSLLLTALLVALCSSHAYVVLHSAARWLLERLQWDGSVPHQIVRRGELELKRAWLDAAPGGGDERGMRVGPNEMARCAMGWPQDGQDERERERQEKSAAGREGMQVGETEVEGGGGTRGAFWEREDEGERLVKSVGKTA